MFKSMKSVGRTWTALIAASAFLSACSGPSQSSLNTLTGFTPDTTTISGGLTGAPLIGSDQIVYGTQSTPANFTTNVAIDPQGSPLTYSVVAPPAHGTLSGCMDRPSSPNGGTRTCTYTPTGLWNGTDTFTYKANDGTYDSAANATVTLIITGVAHAPQLANLSNQTIVAGNAITNVDEHDTTSGNDTDSDGDLIVYSCTFSGGSFSNSDCSALPGTESFNTSTGVLAWTSSTSAAVGNVTVPYTISITGSNNRPTPLTNTQSLTVTVNPSAPILTPLVNKVFPLNNAIQGTNVSYDVNNVAGGAPGNDTGMTYACTFDNVVDGAVIGGADCSTLPGFISFSTSTGVLSWTPNSSADGPYEIKFSGTSAWGTGSTIVEVDVRLNFSGLASITNITGSSMQLNWGTNAGAVGGYNIFLVNSNGSLTLNQNVPGSGSSSAVMSGLSTSTSYKWLVRAIDSLGNPDSNLVELSANTLGSTFSTIANLTVSEGGSLSTPNLSCSDSGNDVPAYSITNQSDANANCTVGGSPAKITCAPSYKTGHSNWTSTITTQCAINAVNLSQTFTLNVNDVNRAPTLAAIGNQTITAGTAITAVNANDSSANNDFDVDLDALAYSCTFSGGGFSAGTTCTSLPGTTSFNTGTGVLNWTSSLAAAVADVQTVYSISITASDQQTSPLTSTQSFTLTVNPSAPVLTTLTNHLYPLNNAIQGTNLNFDANNIAAGSPGNDTGMTYTCAFDTVIDGAVSSGTACTSLPGSLATFNTTTGALSWTPNSSALGPYEIKITGNNSGGSASTIVDVDVRLNFAGISSISAITGSSMQLNWSAAAGATGYNIYSVAANGSLTFNQTVAGGGSTSGTVSGLTIGTSYTWRVQAVDALGNLDSNTVNSTGNTSGATFASIANLAVAEGGSNATANLACTDTGSDTPAYSITSQSDATSNCSVGGSPAKVTCAPGYHTGHTAWTSSVVVKCTINAVVLNQTFTVNVSDTNRIPVLAAIGNQTITAGNGITTVTPLDSDASNDFDVDLDPLLFSCNFSGGGFSANTNCDLLPGGESFNTSTGVLNWTSTLASAVGNTQTVYTINIVANDQQISPLSATQSFTVSVNPSAPTLTALPNHLYPNNNGIQGTNLSFDVNNIAAGNPGNDSGMTYSCVFDTVIDGSVGAGTACTSLPGSVATFNTATGVLSWTPNASALGPYEIKFTGTNSGGSASSIVDVDVRLNFGGITSITNITGTTMKLNWTAITGPTGYNIYSVDGSGNLSFNQTVSGAVSTSATVTGLSTATTYKWRIQAVDTFGNLDSNTVIMAATTDSIGTFSAISTIAGNEGDAADQTAALSCTHAGSTPSFTMANQGGSNATNDANANCTFGGGALSSCPGPGCTCVGSSCYVTCAPTYQSAHSSWSPSPAFTISCAIDNTILTQNMSFTVYDNNRAPALTNNLSTQNVAATTAITPVTIKDTNSNSASTDADGDTITYSCSFAGGGNSAGTACSSLPNASESFNTATGVLSWTPNVAAAVSNLVTAYTITITGSDGYTVSAPANGPSPGTGTTSYTINVEPAIILTAINGGSNFNFNTSPQSYVNQAGVNQYGTYYNQYSTMGGTAFTSQYAAANCPTNPGVPCTYFQLQNNASGTPNTTNMLYTNGDGHGDGCTFTGPGVTSATACSSLPTHYSNTIWNTTNGTFEWYPGPTAYGAYTITIQASLNCAGCSPLPNASKTFTVDVMPSIVTGNYVSSTWYPNLAGYFDASFIDGNSQSTNTAWTNQHMINLASSSSYATFNASTLSTATGLTGDGTRTTSGAAGPDALAFDGSTTYLNLGTGFNTGGGSTATTYGTMIDGWFYPVSVTTANSTLFSNLYMNKNGSGVIQATGGIKVKQAGDGSGRLIAMMGQSYGDILNTDGATIYWPMMKSVWGGAATPTTTDMSGNGNTGTLLGFSTTTATQNSNPWVNTHSNLNFLGFMANPSHMANSGWLTGQNSNGTNNTTQSSLTNYVKSAATSAFDGVTKASFEVWTYGPYANWAQNNIGLMYVGAGNNTTATDVEVIANSSAGTIEVVLGSAFHAVTTNPVTSNWGTFHVVVVYNYAVANTCAQNLQIYVNGTSQALTCTGTMPSSLPNASGTNFAATGTCSTVNGLLPNCYDSDFSIFQPAFYAGTALTQGQVTNHYNAERSATALYAECESAQALTNNSWNHISAWWDAPTQALSFAINGQLQCTNVINANAAYDNATYPNGNNLLVGADPNASNGNKWQGQLGELHIYNQLAAADDNFVMQTAVSNYLNTRYRFGGPQEQLNANGLVLALDAAAAQNGVLPWSTVGCPANETTWWPIGSGAGTASLAATFSGASCPGGTGWQGTGTQASPYVLNFANSVNDYVNFTSLTLANETVINFYNPSAYGNWNILFGNAATDYDAVYPVSTVLGSFGTEGRNTGQTAGQTVLTGHWYDLAYTRSGATTDNFYINVNGSVINANDANSTGTYSTFGKTTLANETTNGQLAAVLVYNRALSQAEICTIHNQFVARLGITQVSSGSVANCNP